MDRAFEIVDQLYKHARVADWEAVASVMSDDLVINEPPSLPYGGEWRGRHALRDLFSTVMTYWDEPVIEQDSLSSDSRTVVSMVRLTITSRRNGERVTHRIAEVTTVEGERVTEMRIYYFDTARVLLELGEAVPA